MKKIVTLFCTSLIVLLMFAAPGNPVQAEESEKDCTCHDVTYLSGSERNKIVSNLIKTDDFKDLKKDMKKSGYKWNGANTVEVVKHNEFGTIMVGVPFTSEDGPLLVATYFDGVLMGVLPPDTDH